MPNDLHSNSFDSILGKIRFKSSFDPNFEFNILLKNEECQFKRLETEEGIFNIFPVGALIVRDTKDIISFIQLNKIDYIILDFVNGHESWYLSITSTAYINNAASTTKESFVSINFTNNLYRMTFKKSTANLLAETNKIEDKVYSLVEIVDIFNKNVLSEIHKINPDQTTVQGLLDESDNYYCLKLLSPNAHMNYALNDNAIQFLNYIASLSVDKTEKEPRFMFWTEFGDYVNYKYFPTSIVLEKENKTDAYKRYESNNYRYSLYDAEIPTQKATNSKVYKRIYSLQTNPTNQFVSKNYYYTRKTPKFLDSIPPYLTKDDEKAAYTTKALTYHFQDDGEKYNIEVIPSNGVPALGITSGADELICNQDWGWVADFNTKNDNAKTTHGSGEYGMAANYAGINYMGLSGYFSRSDNTEMWKNIFDCTEIHPDYPRNFTNTNIQSKDFYYNQIQKNLTELYKGTTFSPKNLEERRRIERENFVLYALCCISDEDTFFANLIRYEPDPLTSIPIIGGTNLKWRYKWEGLKFTNGAGSSYWIAMELWDTDENNKAKGATVDDTWAINLNERTAGLGSPSYQPPGWLSTGQGSGFKYRPIGCNTAAPSTTGATIAHIVKMYKTSIEKLAANGGITMPSELRGKVLYYFTAENVVDGSC